MSQYQDEGYQQYQDYLNELENIRIIEGTQIICECSGVTNQVLKEHLQLENDENLRDISLLEKCRIGVGCGSCKHQMLNWLKSYKKLHGLN